MEITTKEKTDDSKDCDKKEKKPIKSPSPYAFHFNKGYCQLSHQTKKERFPKIFDKLAKFKPKAKRILSFGCSTGEECFAIAKRFSNAEIIGLDIDYNSVRTARSKNEFEDRVFFHTEIGGTGTYDIITVLMTLFGVQEPVPKENWDKAVVKIDKHLNFGGLLVIYTSDYNFAETDIYKRYQTIKAWKRTHNKNNKLYYCGYYRKIMK